MIFIYNLYNDNKLSFFLLRLEKNKWFKMNCIIFFHKCSNTYVHQIIFEQY